jgi:SAM-dependent methyltransferase
MAEITSAKLSIDVALLPAAGAWLLDAGCGDGRHARAAAGAGCLVVGVDYDAAMLGESARMAATHGGGRVDFIVGDVTHLPFRAGVFEGVICTETLEHLPDDIAAMTELARVAADDAMLQGAVPSHFTERAYWALSRGYREAPGGHVRIYRPRVLFGRLRRAGFVVQSMRYVHFVDSLFWLRYCLADFLRPAQRPRSAFEAAVLVAEAQQRQAAAPTWRARIRTRLPRSRLIAAVDAVGAYVWPKSLVFVAKRGRRRGEEEIGVNGSPPLPRRADDMMCGNSSNA